MFTYEQIQNLMSQGFTHDDIMSFVNNPAQRETDPVPVPVPEPGPVVVPDKVPEPEPQPVPEPPKADASNAQVLQAIEKLTQAVQANAIAQSQNKVPQTYTDEDAMAQILNPQTRKPIK